MKSRPNTLEKRIGIVFRDKNLLAQALTHSSYAYEKDPRTTQDNEVLEFLGDAVVGLVTADFFYSLNPRASEGVLSKFKSTAASTDTLSRLARKIKLHEHLLLGRGEEQSGGRKKRTILAGAFEALCGAIYLDQGYEAARTFLKRMLDEFCQKTKDGGVWIENFKSALQEYLQKQSLPLPEYRTVVTSGPDHRKSFVVEVQAGTDVLVRAKGSSKKNAEQRAAHKALRLLQKETLKGLSPGTFSVKK